jgi:hypothetical protein
MTEKDLQFVIPICELKAIEKKTTFGLLQRGLSLTIHNHKQMLTELTVGSQFFFALLSRDQAYDMIDHLWQTKKQQTWPVT